MQTNTHSNNKNTNINKQGFIDDQLFLNEENINENNIDRNNKTLKRMSIIAFILFFMFTIIALNLFGNDEYYTVKYNDTIESIAKKFNVPQKNLLNINEMDKESDLKSNARIQIPEPYDIYTAKEGESLYDISLKYGVTLRDLLTKNNSPDSMILKQGQKIYIPSKLSNITIKVSKNTGLTPLKVEFSIETDTRSKLRKYIWNLDDGNYSNKKSPIHVYNEKGIYKVQLSVIDENHNEIKSNVLILNVRALANIEFTNASYFELNKGDIISLNAKAVDNIGNPVEFNYKVDISGTPALIEQIGTTDRFQVIKSGYANLKIHCKGYTHNGYYFVSPVPAKNASRSDLNWYRTQFKTGINGNCGPACTAMSIIWATGIEVQVSDIRNTIGLPYFDGAIGYNHIMGTLDQYSIKYSFHTINTPQDIFDIIDKGRVAIVLFDMGKIERVKGTALSDLFGSYYDEGGGHYIVVKGYTTDRNYFIVYDPMPADWWMNNVRYADGVSMIGRNRYYMASNLIGALLNLNILEIYR